MTHIKVAGPIEFDKTALLIPNFYREQMINGLFHLYEHIIVHEFEEVETLHGFTAEDYIFLYFREFSPDAILDRLKNMDFSKIDLTMEKRVLSYEFERERNNEEEDFFKKIWAGTCYEKSPLGDVPEIEKKTTTTDLMGLHEKVMNNPQFFYEKEKGLTIIDNSMSTTNMMSKEFLLTGKSSVSDDGRALTVCYFEGNIEPLFIIEKYIKERNPGKVVQVSEKKEMAALIIEEGCSFPAEDNISTIKKYILMQLKEDIKVIRRNFVDTALNELESIYFYGIPWQERLDYLDKLPEEQILKTVREINA